MVNLELPEALAEELDGTMSSVLSDMSSEIADTDNPAYRKQLQARRERLRDLQDRLSTARRT